MAKSIRSKTRRKSRAEFRNTIGEAAYQASQAKIQETLKTNVEQQSFQSLERLSGLLSSGDDVTPATRMETELPEVKKPAGENKVIPRKRGRHNKHGLKSKLPTKPKPMEKKERTKARFHCEF